MQTLKDRIKEIPVSQVIGQYISLQQKGNLLVGLCPFHNDSHPSLQVNDTKGMYRCFVCDIGGDAISFVEKYKQLSFIEAMEDIARLLSLPLDRIYNADNQDAYFLLELATKLYFSKGQNSNLLKTFQKERGLNDSMIEKYRIGLSENGTVANYLRAIKDIKKRERLINLALKVFLIRKKGQEYYDALYNRIIFPIFKRNGQVVGFSGRAISSKQESKYVNSQDSFIFNKKRIVYGLNFAASAISKENKVILVEGYMDHIALMANGISYSVAIMGIGIGEEVISELLKLTTNIYLALDNDTAGQAAANRINDLLLTKGIIPLQIDYGSEKDADEFFKKNDINAFKDLIKKASPFIDLKISKIINEEGPAINRLHDIFKILKPLGKGLQAIERAIKYAKELGMDSDSTTIVNEYKESLDDQIKSKPIRVILQKPNASISRLEKAIVCRLIEYPQGLMHVKFNTILDTISSEEAKKFLLQINKMLYEIEEKEYFNMVSSMVSDLSNEMQSIVSKGLWLYSDTKLKEEEVNALLNDLENKLKRISLQHKFKEMAANGDEKIIEVQKELRAHW